MKDPKGEKRSPEGSLRGRRSRGRSFRLKTSEKSILNVKMAPDPLLLASFHHLFAPFDFLAERVVKCWLHALGTDLAPIGTD